MKIQIVGMPLRVYNRFSYGQLLATWAKEKLPVELRFLNSTDQYRVLVTDGLLRSAKQNIGAGFSRLIIYPTTNSGMFKKAFKFDCRLSFLDFRDDPDAVTWEFLKSTLDSAIETEISWKDTVGPEDVRDALFLPPPTFAPHQHLKNFWDTCDAYDATRITHAKLVIEQFTREHRMSSKKGQCWTDKEQRQFHIDRSYHGRTAAERDGECSYRFAFPLPVGFHYDVERADESTFWLSDRNQVRHKNSHLNVTPWGDVRE